MNEDKLKFFSEVNMAKDALKRAGDQITNLWNDGVIRLREDDIEEMTKADREIKAELKRITGVRDLFSGISNHRIQNEEAE